MVTYIVLKKFSQLQENPPKRCCSCHQASKVLVRIFIFKFLYTL